MIHPSPVFRDLLLQETPLQSDQLPHILLSDMHYEVACALLEFLYTDTVSRERMVASSIVHNLHRAAEQFNLPLLSKMCQAWIAIEEIQEQVPANTDDELHPQTNDDTLSKFGSSLVGDLSELIDDTEYADVCFRTSDHFAVFAHM